MQSRGGGGRRHLLWVCHGDGGEVGHVVPVVALPDLESLPAPVHKQVSDLLAVNLSRPLINGPKAELTTRILRVPVQTSRTGTMMASVQSNLEDGDGDGVGAVGPGGRSLEELADGADVDAPLLRPTVTGRPHHRERLPRPRLMFIGSVLNISPSKQGRGEGQ